MRRSHWIAEFMTPTSPKSEEHKTDHWRNLDAPEAVTPEATHLDELGTAPSEGSAWGHFLDRLKIVTRRYMGERLSATALSWWIRWKRLKRAVRWRRLKRAVRWKRLKRAVRWNTWYVSKISLFMVAMYYAGLTSALGIERLLLLYALLLGFACASASFGYMINDLFDRSVDRIAGKPNALAALSQPEAIILVAASCAVGLIMAVPLLSTAMDVALVIVAYGLMTVYSAPPIRLKERGVAALLAASAAQRTVPALIVFHTLGVWDRTTVIFSAFISLVGIRWIIVHQIQDAENDRRSGVQTLAIDQGTKALYQVLKYLLFPAEVICLTLVMISMMTNVPGILAIFGVYGLWLLIEIPIRRRRGLGTPLGSFKWAPLADFYDIVLPLALATALVSQSLWFVIVPVFTAVWLRKKIIRKITYIKWLVWTPLSPAREQTRRSRS
jgi:4-hydroxybenzoate polyprenyltransferase